MFKRLTIVLLTLTAMILVACNTGPTGDTASDRESAQSLMPVIPGYTSAETQNIQDAITAALGGATVASGNLPAAAAIERLDALIDCYRSVGAVDARVFVSEMDSTNLIPTVGAIAIINESRVIDNFLACATGNAVGAQAMPNPDGPCVGSGRITVAGDSIAYVYGASSQRLCDTFVSHFTALNE